MRLSRIFVPALAVVLAGCSGFYPSASSTGQAKVIAKSTQALVASSRLTVTVTGSGISGDGISYDLTQQQPGEWQGTITQIPEGTNRTFTAQAFDGSGTLTYKGETQNVTITAGQTALVEIILQEVSHQPPHDNVAPVIDGVAVGVDQPALDQSTSVSVTAHDPNASDTLSYAWTASAGSFANAASASTTYTAPSTSQIVTLTITVSDQDGAKAVESFDLMVGLGSATVSAHFNDWPIVSSVAVERSPILAGASTAVSVVASDPNGDALTYAWTSVDENAVSCGTFDNAASSSPVFTVDASEGTPSCTLTVTVTDAYGGTGTGSIRFGVGDGGPVTFGDGPVLVSSYQSTTSVAPGQTVTLRVSAHDTADGAVTFTWANGAGSLTSQETTPGFVSEATWTAPVCLATGEESTLQVTVSDTNGNQFTLGFPMSGPGDCMTTTASTDPLNTAPVDSAPVSSSGAEIVSPTLSLSLDIPAEALSTDTTVTVQQSTVAPPADAPANSIVVDFGPAGTVFAHPITVRLPLPAGATTGNLYWQRHNPDGTPAVDANNDPIYDNVGGTVVGGYVVGQISHFSSAYVGPVATTRTVSGSQVISYQGSSHSVINQPSDFTQNPPSAIVYSDGGYVELPGTGATDGTFVIPDVPTGEYILHAGDLYVVTSNDTLDMGWNANGRPDALPIGDSPTQVTMNFTNAAPYGSTGELELVSADVEQCAFGFDQPWSLVSGGADAGDTSFSMTIDFASNYWCGPTAGLIQGSMGDQTVLGQIVTTTSDAGTALQVMQKIATVSFDMVEDGGVSVDVPFQTLPPSESTNYTLRSSQFFSYLVDGSQTVLPNVAPTNASVTPVLDPLYAFEGIDIEANGGGNSNGQVGATLDLAMVTTPISTSTDLVTGGMDYGLPDGNWGIFTGAIFSIPVQYTLPCPDSTGCPNGVATPYGMIRGAGMFRTFDTSLQPSGPIAPTLSPVPAVRANGISLATSHTGIGTMPTLSWDAPLLGSPDIYTVTVYLLGTFRDDGGNWRTGFLKKASITTSHTSLTLPPSILEAGQPYVFVVTASNTGLANPLQAPYRQATTNAQAAVVTDIQYPY